MVSVDCNDNATLVLHNTHVTHLPYTYCYVTKVLFLFQNAMGTGVY